jgi:hypothetical protein
VTHRRHVAEEDDVTTEDDEEHPEERRFVQQLAAFEFADRYYTYCAAHGKPGPDIPTATQKAVLEQTGRTFKYDKHEDFFAWRDVSAPKGCQLGVNIAIRYAAIDWILVFRTPSGHLGGPFSSLALQVKRLDAPAYRHDPPYPSPDAANKQEFAKVLDEGFELYDELAAFLMKTAWK